MKIFVEGLDDRDFLIHYLAFLNLKADIVNVDGNGNLQNNKEFLDIEASDKEDSGKCLVIFDADDDCKKARENVKKQTEGKSGCKVFLLPNDKSSGNLETLLEQIAKCPCVLTAFDKYVKFVGSLKEKCQTERDCEVRGDIKTPNKKSKWFAYKEACGFKNDKSGKSGNKFEFEKFLDFESEHLADLKQFLNDNLPKNEESK